MSGISQGPRRLLGFFAAATSVITSLVLASAAVAAPTTAAVGTAESQMVGVLSSQLSAYATTYGPYSSGEWLDTQDSCWACADGGAATAAATSYVLTGASDATLFAEATDTINTAITTRQTPSGEFEDTPGETSSVDGIMTIFFGAELGTTYQILLPYLPAAEASAWRSSLAATATYLINDKDISWYANGNITLAVTEIEFLAWKGTGGSQYLAAYNTALNFVIAPPQTRWPGCGLIITKAPSRSDGSDGAGYFAEIGPGGTGFDPEYTELQLEVASQLYLLSGDPRVGRLVNLITNQLTPLVNAQNQLNTSGGTRHTQQNRYVDFMTPAFAVLSLFGGRDDLDNMFSTEAAAEVADYNESWQEYNAVYRRSLGNDVSVSALADAMWASSHTLIDQLTSATATTTGILLPVSTSPSTQPTTVTTTTTSAPTTTATGTTTAYPVPTRIPVKTKPQVNVTRTVSKTAGRGPTARAQKSAHRKARRKHARSSRHYHRARHRSRRG
jgi:hypothetical protein